MRSFKVLMAKAEQFGKIKATKYYSDFEGRGARLRCIYDNGNIRWFKE